MTWSAFQKEIFSFTSKMESSLVIQARAGSGKTTTIVEACKTLPANSRVLFCAFNKSIAKELGERVPSHVETSTLHALGFKLIRERFKKVRVDEYRTKDLVREIMLAKGFGIDSENGKPKAGVVFNISKLAGLGKNMMRDTQADLLELAYEFECAQSEEDAVRYSEIAEIAMDRCAKETSKIDFDDMIYLTWKLNLVRPIYDYVIVDEAQDMNAAQLHLSRGVCKGKMIVVGDDRQAIYGWRGADSGAMARMADELDAKVLPLSVTYRCAKAIVKVANEIVPDLESAPNAIEGEVSKVQKDALESEARPGDFVLSRKNAPLASLCLRYLAQGIPATIAGRDVGKALLTLIEKVKATDLATLATGIEAWREAEVTRFRTLGKDKPERWEAKIQEVEDKADCILALMEGCSSVDCVTARIESMFSDATPTSKIVLSTVHKAKGLERDRVWVLTETFKRGRNEEEDNLWYVAVTRARKDLRLVEKTTA